jgi:hypothetical protein
MFVDRATMPRPAPFRGADFNSSFTTENHSAPLNGAGGIFAPRSINMSPPNGVKPVTA